MEEKQIATMREEDWQNLRMQLKVLVDIYCELNGDVYKIKELLKKITKVLCEAKKKKVSKKK